MNKKVIGYLIAILLIGSMIVITVKSNMEKVLKWHLTNQMEKKS